MIEDPQKLRNSNFEAPSSEKDIPKKIQKLPLKNVVANKLKSISGGALIALAMITPKGISDSLASKGGELRGRNIISRGYGKYKREKFVQSGKMFLGNVIKRLVGQLGQKGIKLRNTAKEKILDLQEKRSFTQESKEKYYRMTPDAYNNKMLDLLSMIQPKLLSNELRTERQIGGITIKEYENLKREINNFKKSDERSKILLPKQQLEAILKKNKIQMKGSPRVDSQNLSSISPEQYRSEMRKCLSDKKDFLDPELQLKVMDTIKAFDISKRQGALLSPEKQLEKIIQEHT